MTYLHYSFDLWYTLIRSNPEFKITRAKYFYEKYNFSGISLDDVKSIFRQIDLMSNVINQKTGRNLTSVEMYLMVIYLMNQDEKIVNQIDLIELDTIMEEIFLKYPASLFDSNTYRVLNELKEKNKSLSILSNTAFIKGRTLRLLLKMLNVDQLFDFQIYSDELGFSKPDKYIFQTLHQNVNKLWNYLMPNKNIIHIGDNILADSNGAALYGIDALIINTNNQTILKVLDL